MNTVIYARYSAGPRQTDQSIEGQLRVCTDFCKQRGLTVIDTYCDRHISGRTDERPEFQRLIADAKRKKFEAVVVYKTDRFARNKYDSAVYKRELKRNGIQIFYAAEAIPDGPEGIILESLMEGLAEYYSAELAQKIKRGMHERAIQNYWRNIDFHGRSYKASVEGFIIKSIEANPVVGADPVRLASALRVRFYMTCNEHLRQRAAGYKAPVVVSREHRLLEEVSFPRYFSVIR